MLLVPRMCTVNSAYQQQWQLFAHPEVHHGTGFRAADVLHCYCRHVLPCN